MRPPHILKNSLADSATARRWLYCRRTRQPNQSERQMNRLAGKRALITGGTTGIGLETARQFLHEGARVMITGNNPANLDAARKELGPDVVAVASDASDAGAQKQLAETVRQAFGALDVLFVNA